MTKYKVFVNGKTYAEMDSAELKEKFGIAPLKAKHMSNEHRPESIEIRLEEISNERDMSPAAIFKASYGVENYNAWITLNKRYGTKVKI